MNSYVCQSCGMPMPDEALYGTDKENNKVTEYCKYCYEDGAFTQPELTLGEMIEVCVPIMVKEGMEEQAARTMMQSYLPNLKRWSSPGDGEDGEGERKHAQPDYFVEKAEIHLMGIAARTTNANELSASAEAQIPKLWERFWQESVLENIPGRSGAAVQVGSEGSTDGNANTNANADANTNGNTNADTNGNAIFGCYTDYENGAFGEYTILLGASVSSLANIPEGMAVTTLPAARYAVFTTAKGPMNKVVIEAWQAIWQWSAAVTDLERTFTGDFELYDERSSNPEDAQVDIYIAVQSQDKK
ncbi:effector binding domain-containing protein [Paenibacillus eucommiae]|uniref:Transcriptional regulator YdeE n=1 Tax=Paenibacillus eucommiae TaxID=1355755 RepID=A0ABS4IU34_9BACL|nr:zinc ribbon domain-containing protein [Paenibacillus eucommiae]MBP1991101.1 putative transcriptional regulator YdeE [Paenibacillus eucommiae]